MGSSETATWQILGLDPRVVVAAKRMGWQRPTSIQKAVIGCALNGRDIIARARTGSGKTGAYALPLLHTLLAEKMSRFNADADHTQNGIIALILVPTKELVEQTTDTLKVSTCIPLILN